VFSQLLQLFSRGEFARAVKEHSAERNAKGFTSWGQFVAMLFCQVAQLKSLREVCMGLAKGNARWIIGNSSGGGTVSEWC
jgi:hypothetical protein